MCVFGVCTWCVFVECVCLCVWFVCIWFVCVCLCVFLGWCVCGVRVCGVYGYVCVEECVSENAGWCKNWPHANAASSFYYVTVLT